MSKCLTCKYEPDWSKPFDKNEYQRRYGKCKYKMEWPKMPWICLIQTRPLIRYLDNSGLPSTCPTWEEKDNQKMHPTKRNG